MFSWPTQGQFDLVSNSENLFRSPRCVFYDLDFSTPFGQVVTNASFNYEVSVSVSVSLFLKFHPSFRPAHAPVHGSAPHCMCLF
jgi:hypothetical protein